MFANKNIGVNQQVNNRALDAPAEHPKPAQTREPLELHHGQRLDAAKTGATSKADSALVPVAKLNGAQNKTRQGKAKASRNAYKGGGWLMLRTLRRALRAQEKARRRIRLP